MSETEHLHAQPTPDGKAGASARTGLLPIWAWAVGALLSALLIYSSATMIQAQGRAEQASTELRQALRDKEAVTTELAAAKKRLGDLARTISQASPAPRLPAPAAVEAGTGASAEVADLKARLETAQQERDAARRKHQESQDALASLSTQVSTLKAEATTLRETTSGLEANIAEANAKLERAQAAAERYREKARSLEAELQTKF